MGHHQLIALLLLLLVAAVLALRPGENCGERYPQSAPAPSPRPLPPGLALKHVTVFTRHGDRTAVEKQGPNYACWPNASAWSCHGNPEEWPGDFQDHSRLYERHFVPGRNYNPGTCFLGELTQRGVLQHAVNGRLLRQRYVLDTALLPPTAEAAHPLLSLRTDVSHRVILSAEALMLAMLPPSNANGLCDTAAPWRIEMRDGGLENLLPNVHICPTLTAIQNAWLASPAYQAHLQTVSLPLQRKIGALLNIPLASVTADSLGDCFICNGCNDKLPQTITQALYDQVVADYVWGPGRLMNQTTQKGNTFAALSMGFLFEDALLEINASLSGHSKRRFALIGGHDTTILPILVALGVWDGQWPHYGAMLRLEVLSNQSGALFVRLLYNLEETELRLPGCDYQSPCPWESFVRVTNGIIAAAKAECGDPVPPHRGLLEHLR